MTMVRTDREVIEAALSVLAQDDGEAADKYGAAYEQALQRDDWASINELVEDVAVELDDMNHYVEAESLLQHFEG